LNTTQTTTYNTSTVTWTPTSTTDYQYFETTIPIDPTLTSFIVTVQGPAAGVPFIDDVSFYPVGSDISSSTYFIPYGKNSITTNGNVTKYTVFDGLGRLKYVLDTYNNIREKDSYRYPTDPAPTLSAGFTYPSNAPGGTYDGPTLFTATGNNCIDGTTYTWTISYKAPPNYTPTTYGTFVGGPLQTLTLPAIASVTTYDVTLTVSHPLYGIVSSTQTITEVLRPATLTICATGAASICGSSLNVLSTYSCVGVPAPTLATGTNFAINSVTGLFNGESITGYQWMTRPAGTLTWSNTSTLAQYGIGKMIPGQPGYDVQCQITTNVGRTGTTPIMTVTVVTSGCN
jgi:hypothetical protein